MTRLQMVAVSVALASFVTAGALLMARDDSGKMLDASTRIQEGAAKVAATPAKAVGLETEDVAVIEDVAPTNSEPASLEPEQLAVGDNPEYPTLDMRLTEMQARRDGEQFDPQQVLAAMQQPAAWTPDDSVADELKLSDNDRYDGRSFVRFNPLKVETLMPGDTMDIPIQQINANYQMEVSRVEAHGDGSVTWHGSLKDFESENQVSITQSKGMTYIGISTPDVPYTVQVHGNAGFVVSSGTLFKGRDEHLEVPEGSQTAGHPSVGGSSSTGSNSSTDSNASTDSHSPTDNGLNQGGGDTPQMR